MAVDQDALDRVLKVVEPMSAEVDRDGSFPSEGIAALQEAGFLALTDLGEAAAVVERLSSACGSTAMVALMHYAAASVINAHGPDDVKQAIAAGRHLTTLALSEAGSRSHFWAPGSMATADGDRIRLDARKSWVTSGAYADSYVWSSRPLAT